MGFPDSYMDSVDDLEVRWNGVSRAGSRRCGSLCDETGSWNGNSVDVEVGNQLFMRKLDLSCFGIVL